MKKITKFLFLGIVIFPFIFIGCQKSELIEQPENKPNVEFGNLKSIQYCGEAVTLDLFEYGYGVDAGQVIIGNDNNDMLHVTINTDPGVTIIKTRLFIGPESSIPGDNLNNGEGQFFINSPEFLVHEFIQPYPSQDYYGIDINGQEDCFAVVVNALVRLSNGSVTEVFGTYPLKVWGYYIEYCKQACETAPPLGCPKIAFAHNDTYSICFRDIKRNGTLNPGGNGTWYNFILWGWTNGEIGAGTYEFDLWAGSEGCDPSAGILVGDVTLDYDGSTAQVSFTLDPAYILKSTYVYVGNGILPYVWGKYRVAPLFYPEKHYYVDASEDSFTIGNLSGNIYIAASAIVKDAD